MKTSTLAALTKSVLAVALVALSACGGDAAEEFVGTWNESGSMTLSIGGQTAVNAGQMTTRIDLGMSPGEIFVNGTCGMPAKVKGDTATVQSGFSCSVNGSGYTATLTYRTASYTLNGDSITANASGDVVYIVNGQSVAGTFSYNANLVKVAK